MILVTGGTGFIGSHLLEQLRAAGRPVRCLVRRTRAPRNLPRGVEPAYGNLVDGEGVKESLQGVTTIIHVAGVTKALRTADYYAGNTRATETLARAAAGTGARFVHVSSLAAIGPSVDGVPVREDASPCPVTHYGKSKLEAERIVRSILPHAAIVRPPLVYGPRDTDVFQLLKSISKGLVLEIAGGDRWFSAIYAGDLAAALITAAENPRAAGREYFVAYPKPVSWAEFGAAAAHIMARRPRIFRVPLAAAYSAGFGAELWSWISRRPGIVSCEKVKEARCRYWTCDSSRAAAELGFRASTDLSTGLALTLAWYKEAGWLSY